MSPYLAYREYLALKNHFNSDTYDYFKYRHKVSGGSEETFSKRKDHRYFNNLSIQKDPINLMVSNFAINPHIWIGDIISDEGKRTYLSWKRRMDSLPYTFSEEIKQLHHDFNFNFTITPGTHPVVIRLYLSGKISLETLIILVDTVGCYNVWDKKLSEDDVVWKEVSLRINKYRPFLKYNRTIMKKIMLDFAKSH